MVLCSGAFDGLHAGHVRYLRAAAALCQPDEPLLVAVAPDGYIRAVKGREPYWSQADRMCAVGELQSVSDPLLQEDRDVAPLVRHARPRLFVKGADWAGKLPQDVIDACGEVDCQIVYVHTPGRHVSEARG